MNTKKKVLLVTTVSGFVPQFEMSNVHILQNLGYEVHYAANYHTPSYGDDNHRLDGTGIIRHQIDFVRSPFQLQNIKVYKQLKQLMAKEHFDAVHCHTPMGGVMARLAAHATSTAPVIYTAHGFHFFTGAPIINWLCYYPTEKFLSLYTDQQICINQEDYNRAKAHFYAKYVDYIPGVGICLNKIQKTVDNSCKRAELGLSPDKSLLLSTGELIKRKNHETILHALALLKKESPNFSVQYVICGHGILERHLRRLADDLHVSDCVSFLGYREDMGEIYQIADLFLFPSFQEGLPVALLEAMAYGLPVICSDIRGNRDLMGKRANKPLTPCSGGIMVQKAGDAASYCEAIKQLLINQKTRIEMGHHNEMRAKRFSDESVKATMEAIYKRLLKIEG